MDKTESNFIPPLVLEAHQRFARPTTPIPGVIITPPLSRCNTPRQSPNLKRKKLSVNRLKQREEFLTKYSPLTSVNSSKDLFASQKRRDAQPKPFILDPTGRKAYNWLLVVGIAVVYFTWSIVGRIAFPAFQQYWLLWVPLDILCYGIYAADLFMQTRTSYLQDGILEENLDKMVDHYSLSWQFYIDIVTAIPMDWLYLIMRFSYPPLFLHFPKLLKLYRLKQFYDRTESRSHFPNISRVLFLLHNMIVIIHWNACLFFSLSKWIGFGSDSWVYPAWNSTHDEWGELSRQYIYSFYWSALTLTTIGELPQPQTNLEYVFVICDYLIGILMFATIVGNVGNIITNTQKSKAKFQSKMDNVKVYMKQTNVPEHLREKVIKWFDYLWTHGHPMDDQHVLNTLPEKLKAEIGIYVHFETLKKVDFFSVCEPGLLWELVVRLRTQVYSPAEYVCRKGDVGREMYIVNSGKLEVMADEDGVVLKELTHGEYFGEISVLNLGTGKGHRRRTAFVRSLGYSTLLCLSQGDLLDVLKDYPQTMEMLVAKGKKKLSRDVSNEGTETSDNEQKPQIKIFSSDDEQNPQIKIGYSDDEQSSADDYQYERKLSTSSYDSFPRLEASTVADQVSDLHVRMNQMEGLMTQLLIEVKLANKSNDIPNPPPVSTLKTISERIRKVSSFN